MIRNGSNFSYFVLFSRFEYIYQMGDITNFGSGRSIIIIFITLTPTHNLTIAHTPHANGLMKNYYYLLKIFRRSSRNEPNALHWWCWVMVKFRYETKEGAVVDCFRFWHKISFNYRPIVLIWFFSSQKR